MQVLPVVPRGTRASIVNAAIKCHDLWQYVTVMRLTLNMRVQRLLQTLGPEQAAIQQEWADLLLAVGEGRGPLPLYPGMVVQVPDAMVVPGENTADLVRDIFGDLEHPPQAGRACDWLHPAEPGRLRSISGVRLRPIAPPG